MRIKVTFEVELPDAMTLTIADIMREKTDERTRQINEWLSFALHEINTLAIDNPLSNLCVRAVPGTIEWETSYQTQPEAIQEDMKNEQHEALIDAHWNYVCGLLEAAGVGGLGIQEDIYKMNMRAGLQGEEKPLPEKHRTLDHLSPLARYNAVTAFWHGKKHLEEGRI